MTRKASAPREIGVDQAAIDNHSDEEVVRLPTRTGMMSPTRRYISPFVSLRDTGTLTPNQSAAAGRFMELYAKAKGIAGRKERDDGVIVDFDRSGHDPVYRAMIAARSSVWAHDQLYRIKARIGETSYGVLTALCAEFLEGDGIKPKTEDGKPLTRWREAVKAYFKGHNRTLATPNEQNMAVWWACHELEKVS